MRECWSVQGWILMNTKVSHGYGNWKEWAHYPSYGKCKNVNSLDWSITSELLFFVAMGQLVKTIRTIDLLWTTLGQQICWWCSSCFSSICLVKPLPSSKIQYQSKTALRTLTNPIQRDFYSSELNLLIWDLENTPLGLMVLLLNLFIILSLVLQSQWIYFKSICLSFHL